MQIIGHRGYSGRYPENTLLSFRKALEAGADMLELDIHVSRDGQLVVIHDSTLERTTKSTGKILSRSSEELINCDAGMGEPVPLLTNVLELAGSVPVNIELKGRGSAEALSRLFNTGNYNLSLYIVSSFNRDMLQEIRPLQPDLRLGLLSEGLEDTLFDEAAALQAWSIHLNDRNVQKSDIRNILSRGYPVFIYTVNDTERAIQLREWGVTGIFTDFPGEMKKTL